MGFSTGREKGWVRKYISLLTTFSTAISLGLLEQDWIFGVCFFLCLACFFVGLFTATTLLLTCLEIPTQNLFPDLLRLPAWRSHLLMMWYFSQYCWWLCSLEFGVVSPGCAHLYTLVLHAFSASCLSQLCKLVPGLFRTRHQSGHPVMCCPPDTPGVSWSGWTKSNANHKILEKLSCFRFVSLPARLIC